MGPLILVCQMMHVPLDEVNHVKLNPQNLVAVFGEGSHGVVLQLYLLSCFLSSL